MLPNHIKATQTTAYAAILTTFRRAAENPTQIILGNGRRIPRAGEHKVEFVGIGITKPIEGFPYSLENIEETEDGWFHVGGIGEPEHRDVLYDPVTNEKELRRAH